LQATSIKLQSGNGSITIAAVYCPPSFTITEGHFLDFYNSLSDRFIAEGDNNTKHTHWGSRLVTPKGRQLYKIISLLKDRRRLQTISLEETHCMQESKS